ncbi:14188_t:CDS:10, partial [Ambispora leptoticha]
MAPPQDYYTYDQAVSTSASSQSRVSSNWSNANGTSYALPATTWNGQSQTNGPITVSNFAEQPHSSIHVNNHNSTRPPAPNGISINTSNLPISNNSTILNIEGGNISQLNTLAETTGAKYVIHTGDFGFYEKSTLERITSSRTLRYLIQYSNLMPPEKRAVLLDSNTTTEEIRRELVSSETPLISEFPLLLEGKLKLQIPVYTVWGSCEDIWVLENFRSKKYNIPNLHILDESNSALISIGNVNLRLFGLGGAVVSHKLFDNGEGTTTIAGGGGTMWTTALQIGELVDTAHRVYHPTETRILVTHNSPGLIGLLSQLALALRADFTISAGLHFRYCVSYNEFSVQCDQENYRSKLENSRKSFYQMYNSIKEKVENSVDDAQKALLDNALAVVNRVPAQDKEENAFKNIWNFNLPDAAFGHLLLNVNDGRISAETTSQGFNFSHRRNNAQVDGPSGTTTNSVNQTPESPSSVNPVSRRQPSQWQTLTPQVQPVMRSPSPHKINNRAVSPANLNDQVGNNNTYRNAPSLLAPNETPSRRGTPSPNDYPETKTNSSINMNSSTVSINNTINATTTTNNHTFNDNESNNDYTEINNYTSHNIPPTQTWADHTDKFKLNILPVTEDDLMEFFSSVKDGIEKVRIVFDKNNSSIQRNFAYVDFRDEESLQKALNLNGQ